MEEITLSAPERELIRETLQEVLDKEKVLSAYYTQVARSIISKLKNQNG